MNNQEYPFDFGFLGAMLALFAIVGVLVMGTAVKRAVTRADLNALQIEEQKKELQYMAIIICGKFGTVLGSDPSVRVLCR